MDTEKCAALLCVLESGSLSEAAERLGYTPSGMSRMIAAMEAEAGFPLLVRSRAGVVPTAECEALLPKLRELARIGGLYEAQTASLRGLETGEVRVGSAYGAYYDWLAGTIAQFSARFPGVEVRFLMGSSSEFYELLAAHKLDFCIVSRRESDAEFLPLLRDPLVAWLPAAHPCAAETAYPLARFEQDAYIDTYPDQETDNARAFRACGLSPRAKYRSIDINATRALVAAGLGVSLCNRILCSGLDLSGIAVLPTEPLCELEIGVAVPAKGERSPAGERFYQFAKQRLPR